MIESASVGVIFDCDGTLIDSMAAWRELEADLAERANAKLTKADRDKLNTMTIPECGEYFHAQFGLAESGAAVEDIIHAFMENYYRTKAHARPGAMRFIEELAAKGVSMSVASSTPKPLLEAGLAHIGAAPYLKAIVSVDDVGRSKRNPDVYDRAREIMGTPLSTTWGVEDSLYAIHTLKNAGYHTLAVYDCDISGTYDDLKRDADYCVRSFEELSAETLFALIEGH